MPGLKVCLFGKLCIQRGETVISELGSRKAEELLCYLLLSRASAHPREMLAELLWGDESTDQSKSYLRKALWQVQSVLDQLAGEEGGRLLLAEADWIQINPLYDLWLDVEVVEAAFGAAKGISGRNLSLEQVRLLEAAVGLYKGDLLQNWYLDWCLFERERLQYHFLASLDKLMDYCEQRRDYEGGLAYGERVLRYDRARERTHTRLMRLYYLAGDRTAALRQYEKCQEALQEELQVEPGKLTRQLYQQIRQDALEGEDKPVGWITPPPDDAALQTIHNRLDQFHKTLSQLQVQLQKDLHALERVIRRE